MQKKGAIKIRLLQTAPDCVAQIAQWHHSECLRQGIRSSLAFREQRLRLHMQYGSLPKTIILWVEEELVGCVSLVTYRSHHDQEDNENYQSLSSDEVWLSNLFVVEHKRQQGFGGLLVEAAKKYAIDCHARELWLSASDVTGYYQRRGWTIVRKARLGGRSVNIMRTELVAMQPKAALIVENR